MKDFFIEVISHEEKMIRFGELLGQTLFNYDYAQNLEAILVFFDGDLGVGKTTICKGILRAFGYDGVVTSPTYNLVESYNQGSIRAHHFDLYRLGSAEELDFIGIRDYFKAGDFCLIEWPDRGRGILPAPDLCLSIAATNKGREIKIESKTRVGKGLLDRLISVRENYLD